MVRTRVKYQEETVYARMKFKISDQALNELNRELNRMVSQRACENCVDKDNSNALELINNCCSSEDTFIHSHMPAMEAIFRIIITNGNKPTTSLIYMKPFKIDGLIQIICGFPHQQNFTEC